MDRNYFGLERETETGVGGQEQAFQLCITPDFEFGYINIFGRDISNTQRAEKRLRKMTLERNLSESEVKLAKLIQEEFFQEYLPNLQKYKFSGHTFLVNL